LFSPVPDVVIFIFWTAIGWFSVEVKQPEKRTKIKSIKIIRVVVSFMEIKSSPCLLIMDFSGRFNINY